MSRYSDSINLFSHLTVRRIWNILLVRASYVISRLIRYPLHFGMPISLSIEPTTACNLGCPECPSGLKQFTRPTGKLDLEMHEDMLKQVKRSVFYVNYYFQGEPFLHPGFLELIKKGKEENVYTATSTNGHFIDKKKAEEIVRSGLDRLILSVDGISQETYEQYRVNGELHKVMDACSFMVEAKRKLKSKTPHLIIQFLAVRANEHEIPEVLTFPRKIGVDEVRIKTAQLYEYRNGNALMPENEKYSRYKKQKDGTYRLKGKLGNHCWRMWSGSVFTWDGGVVPCCFDKDAKHSMGSLKDMSFKEIWNSEEYRSFRRSVIREREQIDICKNCSEGTQVWT